VTSLEKGARKVRTVPGISQVSVGLTNRQLPCLIPKGSTEVPLNSGVWLGLVISNEYSGKFVMRRSYMSDIMNSGPCNIPYSQVKRGTFLLTTFSPSQTSSTDFAHMFPPRTRVTNVGGVL